TQLLAEFIEALDDLGVAGDVEVGGFLHEELLVDEVAKNVFLMLGELLVGIEALFFCLGDDLLLRFLEIVTGNDRVVHAGDDLFNHRVAGGREQSKNDENEGEKRKLAHGSLITSYFTRAGGAWYGGSAVLGGAA